MIRICPRMMSPGVVSRGSGSEARNRDKVSNAPFMTSEVMIVEKMVVASRGTKHAIYREGRRKAGGCALSPFAVLRSGRVQSKVIAVCVRSEP